MILHTLTDVRYLPKPNFVEVIASCELAPKELTTTAFVIPLFKDSSILMAYVIERGIEIPGGHIEPGETSSEAAIRELLEEVGATVTQLHPIGYLKMSSEGQVPKNWLYPHPVSYQQFFTGIVDQTFDYIENNECLKPKVCHPSIAFDTLEPEHFAFYIQAVKTLQLG